MYDFAAKQAKKEEKRMGRKPRPSQIVPSRVLS
jgi:hypothetical protein